MKSLNFNNNLQTFCINGDESKTVTIDTGDLGIFDRAENAKKRLKDLLEQAQIEVKGKTEVEQFSILMQYDKKMRDIINYIFNTDVSTPAFGSSCCLSFCDGQPMYVNLINAIIDEIKEKLEFESKQAEQNISKYTSQLSQIAR